MTRRRRRPQVTKAAGQALQGRVVTFTPEQVQALMQGQGASQTVQPMPRPEEWFRAPFGPGTPLVPSPINAPRPDTGRPEPRLWDYPVSWNLQTGGQRLVPWATLRAAADAPLIRQCIQVRKRGITDLGWDITINQSAIEAAQAEGTSRAEAEAGLRDKLAGDIARLVDFWACPDRGNGFELADWLGSLLEEHLVLDAVAIYPRMTYGGDLFAVELLDGSTIKPLLDERGGRPLPPYPAYQQLVHGFPRGEWTADAGEDGEVSGFPADQLVYKRYTVRTWTPYGYSPTEQALIDMDIYLKRLAWMRDEYTPGVQPEAFMENTGTVQWTPEQLREYERAFNDDVSSNRSRWRFLPPGLTPTDSRDQNERYKPDYDLHLIKLVTSHFGVTLPELGFSEAKGLGSSGWSEGQEAVQHRQSVLPTARWLEALLTGISRKFLGMPAELEFTFLGLEDQDEEVADKVAAERVKSARMTLNEDRDRLGLPRFAIPEADKPAIHTASGPIFLEGTLAAQEAGREAAERMAREGGQPGGQNPPKPGPDQEQPEDTSGDTAKAAAEVETFRRWARKRVEPGRRFEFETDRALILALAPDLADDDRVTWKAAGPAPKARWAGWEHDEALAAHYAPLIADALAGAVDAEQLAADWAAARGLKAADPSDARNWLDGQGIFGRLRSALSRVLRRLWTEAWHLGSRSAQAAATHQPVDWGEWTPGDADAAARLYSGHRGLQDLLDRDGIATIRSISATRMNDLAAILSEGLGEGWSVDRTTREIRGLLSNRERAEMIATTEIARAVSTASLDRYEEAGLEFVEWDTAYDARVCAICKENEDAGPVRIGQPFPGGTFAPPQHPHCRCAPQPVLDPPDIEKRAWDPSKHPRGPDGKFIGRTAFASAAERAIGNEILGERPRRFTNAEATRWLRDHTPKLSHEQRAAVERYTGDGFQETNQALRAGKANASDVAALDSAMKPTEHSMILTRVVQPDAFGYKKPADVKGLVGRKVTDRAYMSTAAGSPYAGGLGGVTMHLVVPKGTPHIPVAALSENKHEREILLGRDLEMVVAKVEPNDRYGVDMFVIVLPKTTEKAAKPDPRQADAQFTDAGPAPKFLLDPEVIDVLFGEDTVTKAGGADRNRGNAEQLRHWYVRGEGAARIGWGTPGDFERCVRIAGEHMANPQGYCANRHREATGEWPGRGRKH
ncbi:ADP-ribosyltransferase [Microtetraspora glauca]|uniref:ADP-ribosyltransferase n=1 Tax=Microtetraspora glauca TaxID=1996 RepID=A0ABV3GA50_MICGL